MGSILNERDRASIASRLRSLSASSTARWGHLTVADMLQHLRLSCLMTIGELSVPSANKRPFQVFPLKHLILYAEVETGGCRCVRGRACCGGGVAGADRDRPS